MSSAKLLSIVADVGGTNTRVALADGSDLRHHSVQRFRNADFSSLSAVFARYLDDAGNPNCDAICAAVAGPVEGGVAQLTNLDWQIDLSVLAEAAQAETAALLNDLQAQGYGVAHMQNDKLREILPGAPSPNGASQIVIGVGTGFNIAPIFTLDGRRFVTPSESGHSSLPAHSEEDLSLARFVAARHGFADIEEALSGRGVENIFAWLGPKHGNTERRTAAEIFQGFETGQDAQTTETSHVFTRTLGTVAGDLALIHLPYGGVFLSGGVARAFAPHLLALGFREAFLAKGRFSDLMARFPVSVIEDDFAALAGCAGYLSDLSAA